MDSQQPFNHPTIQPAPPLPEEQINDELPHAPVAQLEKRQFPLAWLLAWLVALPLSIAMAFVARLIFSDGIPSVIAVVGTLIGMYGFVGWIPFVVILLRKK